MCVCVCVCVCSVCKDVKLHVKQGHWAFLGKPSATKFKEAMPWKGKHDLISHVYLQNHLHDHETVLWFSFWFVLSSCCLPCDRNWNRTTRYPLKSWLSVYPVVGVRQGATGPGLRPRGTACLRCIWLHEPTAEWTSFNLVIRLSKSSF